MHIPVVWTTKGCDAWPEDETYLYLPSFGASRPFSYSTKLWKLYRLVHAECVWAAACQRPYSTARWVVHADCECCALKTRSIYRHVSAYGDWTVRNGIRQTASHKMLLGLCSDVLWWPIGVHSAIHIQLPHQPHDSHCRFRSHARQRNKGIIE